MADQRQSRAGIFRGTGGRRSGATACRDVLVAADLTGEAGRQAAKALGPGDVLMMENLRFHPGEEANDADFAARLAALGDIYVGDAFSCAHRAHASVEALPRQMDIVCAGRSMGAELAALDAALSQPKRPVVAVVGGAKVSTKLQILENLVTRVDGIILGGGMANTFLMAGGMQSARRWLKRICLVWPPILSPRQRRMIAG